MITREQVAHWHRSASIHIHQNLFEFTLWLNRLEAIQPSVGIEIGTYRFGTAQMVLEALPSLRRLVTVDTTDHLGEAARQAVIDRYDGRLVFLQGNAAERTLRDRVVAAAGGPIDFAFIDGDHSFEAVSRDFVLYGSLVRPEGLCGFHDVAMPEEIDRVIGCGHFFRALQRAVPDRTELLLSEPGPWGPYGIGVYRTPSLPCVT